MSRAHAGMGSRRWALTRRAVFVRDGWRCRACGRPGRLECDHVTPVHRGGALWDLANLQALCRGCHVAKTAGENRTARRDDRPGARAWRVFVAELRGDGA